MNSLEPRDRELVALGAAMGSNCVPCIEYHIPEARKAGLSDAQIGDAIRLADKVRQVPAKKVLDTALRNLADAAAEARSGNDVPAGSRETPSASAETPCCA